MGRTGSSVGGEGSSVGEVEGSSTWGGSSAVGVEGSSVAGSGVSVVEGGGDVSSLGVGVSPSSSADGAVSPILLGELLVLLAGDVSREGSRVAFGADGTFVDVGGVVSGVGRAAETGAGPALADRLVGISWSLSPAHGILEPAAATPSRALLSTVSPSAPISDTPCLTTTSRGDGRWACRSRAPAKRGARPPPLLPRPPLPLPACTSGPRFPDAAGDPCARRGGPGVLRLGPPLPCAPAASAQVSE